MTKVQMKKDALQILVDANASEALTTAITELMDTFAASNKGAVKRVSEFTLDGTDYKWCNRHEVYEVQTNFGKNPRDCFVAYKQWTELGKRVTEAQRAFEKGMNDDVAKKDMHDLFDSVADAKELRAGRYSIEGGTLQFPEVDGYDYGSEVLTEVPDDATVTK